MRCLFYEERSDQYYFIRIKKLIFEMLKVIQFFDKEDDFSRSMMVKRHKSMIIAKDKDLEKLFYAEKVVLLRMTVEESPLQNEINKYFKIIIFEGNGKRT